MTPFTLSLVQNFVRFKKLDRSEPLGFRFYARKDGMERIFQWPILCINLTLQIFSPGKLEIFVVREEETSSEGSSEETADRHFMRFRDLLKSCRIQVSGMPEKRTCRTNFQINYVLYSEYNN